MSTTDGTRPAQYACGDCGQDFTSPTGYKRRFCETCAQERRRANWRRRMMEAGPTCSACGKQMAAGPRSGKTAPMCQPCRRARPGYTPNKPKRENPWRTVICATCATVFETDHATKKYCNPRCRPSARKKGVPKPRTEPRSKGRTGGPWRRVRAQVIAEESDCWLCGFEVDKELRYPHPDSASADHVVPISEGGDPLDRSNLRLAHLSCNRQRNAR